MSFPDPLKTPGAGPFSRFERSIAWRYLRARRKNGGVALISIISFLAIMLAVAVLIIVMSVMNGFRTELLNKLLGVEPHVYVTLPATVDDGLDVDALVARLRNVPGVTRAAKVIEDQALASAGGTSAGVRVLGMERADLDQVPEVRDDLTLETLSLFGDGERGGENIFLGDRLAASLLTFPGSEIVLTSSRARPSAFGSRPAQKTYDVADLFNVGIAPVDQLLVLMPYEQAEVFFQKRQPDYIDIRLSDPDRSDQMKAQIAAVAGVPPNWLIDWKDKNKAYVDALAVERTMMRLILMLIVAIAALNIISGLVMLVKNKGRDIAILRTIGARSGSIMRIFFLAGSSVGVFGTIFGVILGILGAIYINEVLGAVQWFVNLFADIEIFPADIYLLSGLPSRIEVSEVVMISFWGLGVSMLVTLWPSWRASRLDPVEALRYE